MDEFALTHRTAPARTEANLHPGLLLLHGRGTDENDLLPLAAELDPRLFVVTARGPLRFPWGGFGWYDLDPRGVGYPEPATLGVSIERLERFLEEIVEQYPIDPARLYVGGFSMGAAMSAALALLYPEKVAGAAELSGYLPLDSGLAFRAQDAAGHPIFQAHGTFDDVIPVGWGRSSRDAFETMPVNLDYREYPIAHQISLEEMQHLARWMHGVLDASERLGEEYGSFG